MAETLNMMSVSVEVFARFIREQIEDDDLSPVIGIGKSGVGKTESIYELTQEMGIGFCELRLVTMTETDLLGIPYQTEDNTTNWSSNNLLPIASRDGEKGILVLDEITSCTSTIRAAAYQLLDSKRALGNYKLPPGWKVVALGNGPDDGGVFSGMESAFLSRGRCLRIEPDLAAWKKWAIGKSVNPSIIAFLSFMPEYLHDFDPNEIASVFPCPRSWVSLSKMLNNRERRNGGKPLDSTSIDIYAASCVGTAVAPKFGAFYSYNKSVIDTEDIIAGKAPTDVSNFTSEVMYIVVQNLIKEITAELNNGYSGQGQFKQDSVKKVANACNWLIGVGNNSSLDFAIMAMQDLANNVPKFRELVLSDDTFDDECPDFIAFAENNAVVFGK